MFFTVCGRLLIRIVKWDIYKEIVRGPCGFTVFDSFLDGQTYSVVFFLFFWSLRDSFIFLYLYLSLPFCTHLLQPPLFIYSFFLPCLSPYSCVFFIFIYFLLFPVSFSTLYTYMHEWYIYIYFLYVKCIWLWYLT